ACVLSRRSFAMEIKPIAKPFAITVFVGSGTTLEPGSAWPCRRADLWVSQETYRRVSEASLACPSPPKATKLPGGPARASGEPYRSNAPTAAAGPQHECVPISAG